MGLIRNLIPYQVVVYVYEFGSVTHGQMVRDYDLRNHQMVPCSPRYAVFTIYLSYGEGIDLT